MKGKLIKTDVNYLLEDENGVVIASTSLNKEGLSLAQKNCQAIELGYDLDELAEGYSEGKSTAEVFKRAHEEDFKAGFQKALELIGDKKFSEDDIKEAYLSGVDDAMDIKYDPNATIDDEKHLKSLQQTEWDVEIVEECLDKNCDGINKKGECITTGKPLLDSNNCLTLKTI